MEIDVFKTRMNEAAGAATAKDWVRARRLFEALDKDIHDPFDPQLYGWVYFYLFKSAYMTEDYQRAFELLAGPRMVAVMTSLNGGWVASVGAEVAARLGEIDVCVEQGRRCLQIRRNAENTEGYVMGARTLCAILAKAGADDRAGEFAEQLIGAAKNSGDTRNLAYGYRALARSLSGNPSSRSVDELIAGRKWLESHQHIDWAAEALEILRVCPLVAEREQARRELEVAAMLQA